VIYPYGTTSCKWDIIIPFDKLWKEYNRIVKDNGAIVLFGVQPFTTIMIYSNIKNFKHQWIWDKKNGSNFMHLKNHPNKVHEDIIVFSAKGKVNYYPQMTKGKMRVKGNEKEYESGGIYGRYKKIKTKNDLYYPKSIIEFSNAGRTGKSKKIHPTQKPVDLLEYLIKTYTNDGEVVLDNCMGSGSTGIACLNTNRKFIGIELDEKYFEMAKNRIENHEVE
jgi:site-specific DNA-methyltransferase (adenine-specific)